VPKVNGRCFESSTSQWLWDGWLLSVERIKQEWWEKVWGMVGKIKEVGDPWSS
jgi:hypothetical protein